MFIMCVQLFHTHFFSRFLKSVIAKRFNRWMPPDDHEKNHFQSLSCETINRQQFALNVHALYENNKTETICRLRVTGSKFRC